MTVIADCPTFIDLVPLAAAARAGRDDPFGADAAVLPVRAGPCEVIAVALDAGSGEAAASHADTWMMVKSGSVVLGEVTLQAGESCVVARGTPFAWRCDAPARLIGMRYAGGQGGPAGIVVIDNGAAMAPSNPPAAHLLLGETPSCRSNNHFASADETFKCGIWDSTPYQRTPIFFHHTELMHLLAGEVSFTDAAGRSATFAKGATFIIEQGAECSWDSQVDVAKIYAQFRPAA